MSPEELLTERELFLYKKFMYRKELKDKRKEKELELKEIMKELGKYSDIKIGKSIRKSKQGVGYLKSNLSSKCRRLGIDFKI